MIHTAQQLVSASKPEHTGHPDHNAVINGFGLVRQPGTVLFGVGRRDTIASAVASLGDEVLICSDARMVQTPEFEEIISDLKKRDVGVHVYSNVEPDLPRTNVEDLIEQVGQEQINVVLGLGGGSCLDMAKIATVMLTYGGDVQSYYGEFKVPGSTIPLVTVPTTAGTGAEVTCISVIYEPASDMKVGVASPHLEASATIVDPEFTLTCPPGLTAATGADALSHLIEAFTATAKNPGNGALENVLYVGKNTMADMHCREGIRLVATSLERIMANPNDVEARSATMRAALHAGYAINTTGTAGIHALQAPIGARTHTPHGVGVGVLLPYVMRYNLPVRTPEFAHMADLLGVFEAAQDDLANAHAAIERVEEILATLEIPSSLDDLGLKREDIPTVAANALRATRLTANNPRELSEESMIHILVRAHAGDRSWWS
ncbi:iron-containing alcohol dehydrogenase [Nesterenkonia muleiensis]|uniref:iron-containing alcohol dehydrogenase n=1 Tax=Nesterenkonia muleiensis TaxID=2282648 RepID=UPI00192E38B4|nr:iron-containing alcohol dehydrogenase [Nesterenkonia muleiensis]